MDTEVSMINNVISMADTQEVYKTTGIGARLKSAREAMHLTEKEAASRLYLNVKLITVMESENFAEGPPATFIRGYLHSYARLLDFPDSEINAALKELDRSLPTYRPVASTSMKQNPIDQHDRYVRWITLGIVLVLFSLVALWWHSHASDDMEDLATNPLALSGSVPVSTDDKQAAMASKPATVTENASAQSTAVTTTPQTGQTINSLPSSETVPAATPPVNMASSPIMPPAAVAPVIPLTLATQPNMTTQTPANTDNKAKATSHKKKHSRRHAKVKNIVMSLPEPGGDY